MSNVPKSRPGWTSERVRTEVARHGVKDKLVILGVRGYFEDSMGKPGVNDRGIYDDAIFVLTPDRMWSFNTNTDPSAWRKGVATLRPGVHPYRQGPHGISRPGGGYPAFRPATPGEQLPVDRDGVADPKPGVAINIHKGSYNSTSSLGCQTVYPSQWLEFQKLVYALMDKYGQSVVNYVLIEEQG